MRLTSILRLVAVCVALGAQTAKADLALSLAVDNGSGHPDLTLSNPTPAPGSTFAVDVSLTGLDTQNNQALNSLAVTSISGRLAIVAHTGSLFNDFQRQQLRLRPWHGLPTCTAEPL